MQLNQRGFHGLVPTDDGFGPLIIVGISYLCTLRLCVNIEQELDNMMQRHSGTPLLYQDATVGL